MNAGANAGFFTGVSLSSGNSGGFVWGKTGTNTGYLTVQTYGSNSPVGILGTYAGTSACLAVMNGVTPNATNAGFGCNTGIALAVAPTSSTAAPFTVDTGGNTRATSYTGPATAPTGSCAANGVWVLSQDGHATFCSGGTWMVKI